MLRLVFGFLLTLALIVCVQGFCVAQNNKQQKPKTAPQQTTTQDTISYEQKNQPIEQKNQPLEQNIRNSADLEVDGLIVDQTITKLARDFYDIFQRQWEAPPGAKNFTILIQEKPTRSNGAFVSISVNDEPVFEYNLQPRYDQVEEVANYSVAFIYGYVANNQLNAQLEAEGKKAREVF